MVQSSIKVSLYGRKYIKEIADFWLRNDYFKGINPARLRDHLLWKYNRKFTHLWVVKKQGRIVGSCGRIKRELLSKGKAFCKGPWGIDSLVEESLEKKDRRCVFFRVFRSAVWEGYRKKQREIGFCYPNAVVRNTYLKVGWMDVPIFFKYSKAMALDYAIKNDAPADKLNFSLIKNFDPRWDNVWQEFSSRFALIALREHRYLNWRYCKNTEKKYLVFLIKRGDEIKGYLVLREERAKKKGHIVDFLVAPELGKNFISKVLWFLARRGCLLVDAHLAHQRYGEIFSDLGFKKEKVDLFIYPFFPELVKRVIANKQDWFFTCGDGDFEMES